MDGLEIDLYWIAVHLKAFFFSLAKWEKGWSRVQEVCFKRGGVVWTKAGKQSDAVSPGRQGCRKT